MKTNIRNQTRALLLGSAFCLLSWTLGCSSQYYRHNFAYKNVTQNINALFVELQEESLYPDPGDAKEAADGGPEDQPGADQYPAKKPDRISIPYTSVMFCLDRANELMKKASQNQFFDNLFLAAAGVTAATGLGLGAAAGGMDESGKRTDMAISAAIISVLPGAILGTREAFKTYEVAKAQRIAAARNVDAAISILERYALADDPREVTEDGFTTCRDGDISIANAFPGAGGAEEINSALAKQKADVEEQQKVQATASDKKVVAQQAKDKAAAAEEKKLVAENEQKSLLETLKKTKTAKPTDPAIAEAQAKLDSAAKEEAVAKAKAAEALWEAELAEKIAKQKQEIIGLKSGVREAYARVRRMILYISVPAEITSALQLAQDSVDELDSARRNLKVLERRPPPVPPARKRLDVKTPVPAVKAKP